MAKTFKIWSDDLGYPEADGYVLTPEYEWYDMEDTVHQLISSKYTESWENPNGPFEIKAAELDIHGKRVGEVRNFSVEVDWEPHFYVVDKNPPKLADEESNWDCDQGHLADNSCHEKIKEETD